MEKVLHKVNLIGGAIVALLSGIFGQFWYLFCAFLVLNVTDYVTGILKARFFGVENPCKGVKGIVKKLGYWVCIMLAFFVAVCFTKIGVLIGADLGFTELFGWFTLATFIINEVRSILENLVLMEVEVPEFFIKGLEVTKLKSVERSEGYEDL